MKLPAKQFLQLLPYLLGFIGFCSGVPVIIIGSGPAGIATASRLLEKNFTDFLIVEAEQRIGGRIRTVHFGDSLLDLGAQWCHGQEGNVVYEMAKDLDLLIEDKVPTRILRSSNAEELGEEVQNSLISMYEEGLEKSNDEKNEGMKLGEFFHQK